MERVIQRKRNRKLAASIRSWRVCALFDVDTFGKLKIQSTFRLPRIGGQPKVLQFREHVGRVR